MMSDVYQGRIGNRLVAVKSLRVHIATLDKVEKVRSVPWYWTTRFNQNPRH